jgi:glycerol kinase
MPDSGLFLVLDQSTSATKAMLFSCEGRLLDQEAVAHQQSYPRPGWVEQDAEQIYGNTLDAAAKILERHPTRLRDLIALSITNQRETFVVFDKTTGRPLHPAIGWQCTRGEDLCRQLVAAGHEDLVQQKTGLRIDTYFPASKMRWLLENQPAIREQVTRGQALIGTMDAYLVYRLTAGRVFACDHTNASRTLLLDIHKLAWDPALADLFHIPLSALPAVRACDARYGETNFDGRLPISIPICGVMGDSQAALFAQRCYQPGSAKITFGTGSSILLNIGSQPRPAKAGIVTALAWVIDSQPTYAYEGITNFTGATIQWLRDQLGLIQTPQESETLAVSVADNAGVYLVPAFAGLSAPYWRPDARAAILGLSPSATRAHVARAALESIAYILNDVLQLMNAETGLALTSIYADGGATRNRFLMQFVSDITHLNVLAAQTPELSALGAAFAGMLGMQVHASLYDLEALPASFTEYQPGLPPEQVEVLIAGWKHAVSQVLS